jgi:hypothetical protein
LNLMAALQFQIAPAGTGALSKDKRAALARVTARSELAGGGESGQ